MGLTTLPEVGTGEALGPVKVSRPFAAPDPLRDITVAEHNAAMTALEGVCAEVGLHDGSTAGSLVARVDALEAGGGGTGNVTGPASAVLGHIATFDNISGKVIADSGVDISAIATAQAAADAAQSTADGRVLGPGVTVSGNVLAWANNTGTQASDTGAPAEFIILGAVGAGVLTLTTTPGTLTGASNRAHVIVDTTAIGGDFTLTVPHNLTPQVRVDLRVKGAHGIILATSGGIALTYHGWTQGATITGDGTRVEIIIESTTVAHVYVYPVGEPAHPDAPLVAAITASRSLALSDLGDLLTVSSASGAVVITVPHTLWEAAGAGRGIAFSLRVIDATNAITIVGSGGLVLTYYGSSTITAGDVIRISVESATVCRVEVVKSGDLVGTAQTTANNALPKPGGTTTASGIVTGSGTSGAAVAISTTTIADLQKRLGNVFTLNANTVLDDSHSGGVIFVDTSGGARSLTIPTSVSAGWNAVIVREGANTLNVIGDGTMLMAGPAAAANAVAIAVDDGGVSVIRRSATKCWCAGVIA